MHSLSKSGRISSMSKWLTTVIFIFAAILLFYNLGGGFLWFDETAIAALGENVLKFGYPKGIYNDVPIWSHHGYRPGYAYISRPWLEMYVAALGRLIFGKTNFAARIFFTLFGYFSLVLTYLLSRRFFKNNRDIPLFSLLLLGTSVPFLLQMRQCAYYSLVTFATLWITWSYLDLLEIKKHSFVLFLSSGLFLLLANHGIFAMVSVGILLHHFIFFRQKEIRKYIGLASVLLGLLFISIVWYFKGMVHLEPLPVNQIYPNISYYVRAVNKYVFPYRFYILAFLCIFILKRGKAISFLQKEKSTWYGFYLFGCIFVVSLFMLAFERHHYFRYIVNWLPLLMIMQGYILSKFFKWNKLVGLALLVLLVFTNILNESGAYFILKSLKPLLTNVFHVKESAIEEINRKAEVKTYFTGYIYEITHKYEGPIASIVTYLNKNAKPGDRFKTPYGVTGIMYYTDLKGSKDFSEKTYPEWIILRRDWISPEFYRSDYYREITKKYTPIRLDAVDIPWENRPDDLKYHKFRTVRAGPPLIIFKRN